MAIRGEKTAWSPLETHFKLQHFVWAEVPRPDILASLLPSREAPVPEENYRARLWACGSPGLLVASLDVSTGKLEKFSLPIPMYPPRYYLSQSGMEKVGARHRDGSSLMESLSDTKAVSMVCVGGAQLWLGTERGSVHVFDVPRFFTHHVAFMRDAVLCLATGELEKEDRDLDDVDGDDMARTPTTSSTSPGQVHGTAFGGLQWSKSASEEACKTRYVLAGLANGYVVKFSESGRDIEAPFQQAPEDLCLGSSPVKAMVIAGDGLAWCGVGHEIVVLHVDSMKEVTRFDAQPGKLYSNRRALVSHLVHSPLGIWSACWHTNSVQLWDTQTFSCRTSILSLAHDERARWVQSSADVSAMAVTQGVLTIGTEGGSLLMFDIVPSDSLTSGSAFRPRFLGTEDICSGLIHCIVPLESHEQVAPWNEDDEQTTSNLDSPMRVMTCCAARFDHRRDSTSGHNSKGLRSRLRSKSTEDEETKRVEISCWEFRSAQDHDRHQRMRLYQRLMSGKQHKPFKFPKLTLVRVCPTALVTKPLGE